MILCVCPNPSIDKYIWVENFGKGRVNRAKKEDSFPGGKGVHVALGINELGVETAILGFWAGSTGKWIKSACESRGIKCYGPEVDGLTRTCLTIKSNDEYNETEILGVGPTVQRADFLRFHEEYDRLLKEADLVSFSGSWPNNKVDAAYDQFVAKANEQNKKSLVDCSGNGLLKALEKHPYGVHINHHEGYDLYKTHDVLSIAEKVAAESYLAAISYGSEGLYLSDGNQMVHALSRVDKVISTVGSGDSLMAGMAVALFQGDDLQNTAKLAAACGAANCIREDLGMFYKEDVDRLKERCETNMLNVTKL